MRAAALGRYLFFLGTGAWLLSAVNCYPSGDQIRGVFQSGLLSGVSGILNLIAGAAAQAITNSYATGATG